jgi:hypothetical protein
LGFEEEAMRRLGLVVLVLAIGVSAPASAADWERETGWWIRLVSWWTNPAAPTLELEREVAAESGQMDPDGGNRTAITEGVPLTEIEVDGENEPSSR